MSIIYSVKTVDGNLVNSSGNAISTYNDGNGGIGITRIEYNSVNDIYFIPGNTLGIYYNLEIRIYN